MPPGSSNRAPKKRDAPFPEPSFHYLSRFPVNGPPPHIPQWEPYRERQLSMEPSTSHPLKIRLSLRITIKGAPSMFPNSVPMERDTPSPEPLVYLFIFVCQSPHKGALLHMGKNIRSLSMEPCTDRRPTHNGVRPGSLRGSLMTLLFLSQCHAALGMIPSTTSWVDKSPVCECVL